MECNPVCIVGPTACGKTRTAVEVAKLLGGEVISADSVAFYRYMDIGSAKPTVEEMCGVPHYLVSCVEPDEQGFSVSKYRELALEAMRDIQGRGKVPVICGGSGLYVDSLIRPLNFAYPSDAAVRAELERQYSADSPMEAYSALQEVDAATAARLHPNDRKRVIRALEVFKLSGRPMSSFGNDFANTRGEEPPVKAQVFFLNMERAVLYERINLRVDNMMEQGLLDEVKFLRNKGYTTSLPSMQSLGYRQLSDYLDGAMSLEGAVDKIKQETRHFAKRQIAWFKRYEDSVCVDMTEKADAALAPERIVGRVRSILA